MKCRILSLARVVNDNFLKYRDNDNGMRIIVIAITITRQLKIIAITTNYRIIGDNDNFYKVCVFLAKMEICSYIVGWSEKNEIWRSVL